MDAGTYHGSRRMVGREEILGVRPDLRDVWRPVDELFSVRVTRSFAERANLSDPLDPLAMQVLPHPSELDADGLDDPVGEKQRSPVPWVVQKYPDRVLLLVTKRCHLYCRYCFRRTHAPGERLDPSESELEAALAYIEGQPGVREVILSGGDPLILREARLLALIDRIRVSGRRVRIHTRAPITFPEAITPSFAQALAARRVFVVVHCNHPRELASDVRSALETLADAGVPLLNQGVLLKGVNDDPDVLVELFDALVQLRVRPYYLHHPDEVQGNGIFRLTQEEGLEIVEEVRRRIGGLAMPRYIWDPPGGTGKRDVTQPGAHTI